MTSLDRWNKFWPVTRRLLWGYRFAMWVRNMERGALRSILFLPAVLIGAATSAFFNATIAVLIFREIPREWLFTSRIQRLYDNRGALDPHSGEVVMIVARILNKYDQDHIKGVANGAFAA